LLTERFMEISFAFDGWSEMPSAAELGAAGRKLNGAKPEECFRRR
jgi:hypothetical protein